MTIPHLLVNLAQPRTQVDAVAFAREARAAGFTGVGFTDSPRLFPDPVVETARVLTADTQLLAGPCVLSLPLQHLTRAANSLATLGAHFPHRVVAFVGRGESSLANEGLRPPTLREYAAQLVELRARLSADSGVLLMGAASGPRTITETVRALGAVLIDVGVDPRTMRAAVAHARAADPTVRVFAFARATIMPAGTAQSIGDGLLGSCALRIASAPSWYDVEPETLAPIKDLAAGHDYRRHGTTGALRGVREGSAEQAAAAFVRDRFILAASGEEVSARFAEMVDTGIDGLVLAGALPGVAEHLTELGAAWQAALGVTGRSLA